MPDDLLHTPLPDRAHEALRQAVVEAVDGLTEQVDRLASAFLLLSVTADMAQATKNTVTSAGAQMQALAQQVAALNTRLSADATRDNTAQADIDVLQDQLAALADRVAALESPSPEV
jgi:uncharacterized protein involved in exopolysaccharide biosynthesis